MVWISSSAIITQARERILLLYLTSLLGVFDTMTRIPTTCFNNGIQKPASSIARDTFRAYGCALSLSLASRKYGAIGLRLNLDQSLGANSIHAVTRHNVECVFAKLDLCAMLLDEDPVSRRFASRAHLSLFFSEKKRKKKKEKKKSRKLVDR